MLPLVLAQVNSEKWKRPPQVDYEDVLGIGLVSLCEASKKFDATKGCKFSTYAYMKIRNDIREALRKERVHSSRFISFAQLPDFQVCDETEADRVQTQLFDLVISMLQQLPPVEQILCFRHHLLSMSIEELAREMDQHPRWVSRKIKTALGVIRDRLFALGGKGSKSWL